MIKIVDSISEILIKHYPTHTQYIQEILKGFERPSFFIEFIDNQMETLNKLVYKDTFLIKITYFIKKNEYGMVDKLEQMEEVRRLRDLFNILSIPVIGTDRHMKVEGLELITVDEEIVLHLELSLTNSREIIENYELMGKVIFNTRVR